MMHLEILPSLVRFMAQSWLCMTEAALRFGTQSSSSAAPLKGRARRPAGCRDEGPEPIGLNSTAREPHSSFSLWGINELDLAFGGLRGNEPDS